MRVAALTGLSLDTLLGLDDLQWDSIRPVVEESARVRVWDNQTELLAAIYDVLNWIGARLQAGIKVVLSKQSDSISDLTPYPRPEWFDQRQVRDDEIVLRPADAVRFFKKE